LLNKLFLSDYHYFPDTYVSQGSVMTHLRFGRYFNDHFITCLVRRKNYENPSIGGKVMSKSSVLFFDSWVH